ncbi:C40 family peptidase [Brumimicrobium mesophilum]|uniref:C40 family peptidase n=1 Tax=Brumimicrobium mesophilum TaxID=392717 RepID=UPI000D13F22B|nr:C40 family peptidase [Brumimicrobium mesophilum]
MNLLSIFLLSTLSWSNPDSTLMNSIPTVENVDTSFSLTESILFISDSSLVSIDSVALIVDSSMMASDVHEECQIKSHLIDSLVLCGTELVGTPYRYAGNSSKGIDCSGLIHYMFESMGAEVARNSRDLSKLGEKIPMDEVSKGDLVFFKGRNSNSKTVGHVAIVVEGAGDEMVFLHASSSRGVVIDKISDSNYFKKRLLFAKRLEIEEMFDFTEINL